MKHKYDLTLFKDGLSTSLPGKSRQNSAAHVMLLCEGEYARIEAAKKYLNYSLEKDIFVIYASVNLQQSFYQSKLYRMISNCDQNIASGNLMIFELGPFFESASLGDMEPYEDLKLLLEEIIKERIVAGHKGEIVVFGDCADYLCRCELFEQCIALERWWDEACSNWQKSEIKISVICPHSISAFTGQSSLHFKEEVSDLHTVTLQVSNPDPSVENT